MPDENAAQPAATPIRYADGSVGEQKMKAIRRDDVQARVIAFLILAALALVCLGVQWLGTRT